MQLAERGWNLLHREFQQQPAKPHATAVQSLKNVKHLFALVSNQGYHQRSLSNEANAHQPLINLCRLQSVVTFRTFEFCGQPLQLGPIPLTRCVYRRQLLNGNLARVTCRCCRGDDEYWRGFIARIKPEFETLQQSPAIVCWLTPQPRRFATTQQT